MGKTVYRWELIDPDIIAGMKDKQVAFKYKIPLGTVYFHRIRKLGIVTGRAKWKWGDPAVTEPAPRNPFMNTPVTKIRELSLERKLSGLSPEHRAIFLTAQGPFSAVRQFAEGMRA